MGSHFPIFLLLFLVMPLEPHMMLVMEYVPLGSLVSYLTMYRVNRSSGTPMTNDVHGRNSMIAGSSTAINGPTTSRNAATSTSSPQSTSSKFPPSLPLIDFALDIVNGMSYLESKSIVHRDLAARNILVASPTHVKISDFGLAQFIDKEDSYYRMKTQRGLPLRWYVKETVHDKCLSLVNHFDRTAVHLQSFDVH